ncbi:nuclear transport factor 2 family protein [Nocardioides acrostichi]|uniref:Nuclear transport factor 2 family protein n=1 Tax=Nocardioides acrostichi TaxID=2784339 RepID=A0A930V2M5_9ACTN|nr:nuclear transport factor 2 family protein [Nocardioides acrostichi]MBF4163540.1 nuclear transport factor 2 family protein [Nocardioides acrostichi]
MDELTPALLVDLEAIKQLKYRYLRTLDTKDWDAFEACFTPDVTADYAGLDFADRAALVDYMRTNLGAGLITEHQVHHPEITIDGARAHGRWYLRDRVLVPAMNYLLEGAAFYEDDYVRTDDGWRVSHTGYRRTYELTLDLADWPSAKVADTWGASSSEG